MSKRQITKIKFRICGIAVYTCILNRSESGYQIVLSSSELIEPHRLGITEWVTMENTPRLELSKTDQEIETFLETILETLDVFNMQDYDVFLKTMRGMLHSVYYDFYFQDSDGKEHSFNYHTESDHHPDEIYGRLVNTFKDFFEVPRIYKLHYEMREAFIEEYRKNHLPEKKESKRPWWKFW
jgi:hypothetical protein